MSSKRTVHIAYGRGTIPIDLDPHLAQWDIFEPADTPPLTDPREAFHAQCRHPAGAPPLRELINSGDRVVIVTSDGTRPVPNHLLIPWLLEELRVPPKQITILLGNGTHRPNTRNEQIEMFGAKIVDVISIKNHLAFDENECDVVGTAAGGAVWLNKNYVHADKRIVLGFIEPHFFAGFSGGPKGIVPGIAGIETILHIHRPELIAHPNSTYGILAGNPIQEDIRQMVRLCPPDFLINVTLNRNKEITGFFAGDYLEAHRRGCREVERHALAEAEEPYELVITSNSGFPLDQNLYQTVKGISAAAPIIRPGGTIMVASQCSDGVPENGNFFQLMQIGRGPEEILAYIARQGKPIIDGWQAQILAQILGKAEVKIYADLDPALLRKCKLHPIANLQEEIRSFLHMAAGKPRVAVLQQGPLIIPRLKARE